MRRSVIILATILALVTSLAAANWQEQGTSAAAPSHCVDRYESPSVIEEADAILAGTVDLGVLGPTAIDADLTWTEDPFNDANWRARLQFMRWTEPLRKAHLATGSPEYLDTWRAYWLDWEADNPISDPAAVAAWGPLPTGLRAKILTCALEELPDEAWIEPLLRTHARLLFRDDVYVGHGNHALNQNQGLLAAGCVLGVRTWIVTAIERIKPLVSESIDADGATNEGSVAYAIYNFERYTEVKQQLQTCGEPVPDHLRTRLPRLARFIAHAVLPNGGIPLIGDSNDKEPERSFSSQVRYALTYGQQGKRPVHASVAYERGGWAFGRTSWAPEALPDAVVYALRTGHASGIHSHDDQGQLSVFGFGRRLLEDSGLHAYGNPANSYFYRPRAHNSIVVSGSPYRRVLGSRIESAHRSDAFDLYVLRLPVWRGVRWIRRVLFAREAGWFIVDDRLQAPREHAFRQAWHLAPDADPVLEDGVLRTRFSRGNLSISVLGNPPKLEVITGRERPMQGFIALKYGDLIPTSVLEASRTAERARFVTLLATSETSEAARTTGVRISPEHVIARIEHDGRVDLLRWTDDAVTITCESGC